MNNVSLKIFKLLIQSPLTIDEIKDYTEIQELGIIKNIQIINERLQDMNFKKIKKEQNIYQLELKKEEIDYFYETSTDLTFNERVDYLYLKMIYEKFVNLELEKENMNISRSTILRVFKKVRRKIELDGGVIEHIHGKGLGLKKNTTYLEIGFIRTMFKYFYEGENVSNPLRSYLRELEKNKREKRLEELSEIFEENGMKINVSKFFIFIIVEILVERFDSIKIPLNKVSAEEVRKLKEQISEKYNFLPNYADSLAKMILKIKYNDGWVKKDRIKNTKKISMQLRKDFDLKGINRNQKVNLEECIYLGLLKKEQEILKLYRTELTYEEKQLKNKILNSLKNIDIELYYSDILFITKLVKEIILDMKKSEKFKVLILINELNEKNQEEFEKKLKNIFPNVEFKSFLSLWYKYKLKDMNEKFDLVISEEEIYEINAKKNVKINFKDLEKIKEVIEDFIIEEKVKEAEIKNGGVIKC